MKKGDRVAIYMPMIAELSVATLACARIGAIHSIVVCYAVLTSHYTLPHYDLRDPTAFFFCLPTVTYEYAYVATLCL